jgi:hypothetical protein
MTNPESTSTELSFPERMKRDKFIVIPQLLDPMLVQFLSSYYSTMEADTSGNFGKDRTSMNAYGDACADVCMYMLRDRLQEYTGIELVPAFSFVRHYKKGDKLNRHNDRPSNQVNVTMTITCDVDWPIGFRHKFGGEEHILRTNPGDAVCYWGNELDHWRDKYTGESHVQLITGFIVKDGEYDTPQFRFDGRGEPRYTPRFVKKAPFSRVLKRKLYVLWRNFKHRRETGKS